MFLKMSVKLGPRGATRQDSTPGSRPVVQSAHRRDCRVSTMKTFLQTTAIFLLAATLLSPRQATAHDVSLGSDTWTDCTGNDIGASVPHGINGRSCIIIDDNHSGAFRGYRNNGTTRCSTNNSRYVGVSRKTPFEFRVGDHQTVYCFRAYNKHGAVGTSKNRWLRPGQVRSTTIEGGRFVVPRYNSGEEFDVSLQNQPAYHIWALQRERDKRQSPLSAE